jgi:hypothetical protein
MPEDDLRLCVNCLGLSEGTIKIQFALPPIQETQSRLPNHQDKNSAYIGIVSVSNWFKFRVQGWGQVRPARKP